MSFPPPRGPVGRALQTWLDSPTTTTAHDLAATTAALDPACDVLTDDDVQGSLRRLYDLAEAAPGAIESVTGLRELPPLVRARAALESAVEFELRVRTAHHVAVAVELHEPLAAALLHLVEAMPGPALASYLERHAPRHHVEHHHTLSLVHARGRAEVPADAPVPGHALVPRQRGDDVPAAPAPAPELGGLRGGPRRDHHPDAAAAGGRRPQGRPGAAPDHARRRAGRGRRRIDARRARSTRRSAVRATRHPTSRPRCCSAPRRTSTSRPCTRAGCWRTGGPRSSPATPSASDAPAPQVTVGRRGTSAAGCGSGRRRPARAR